jgi:predicted glycosyl hydrolase (DUF1957 family)
MENLKIGFLLHFYQPWWQYYHVLNEIVNQCYRPILNLFNKAPGFCFSANINYSLLELLDRSYPEWADGNILDHNFCDVVFNFRKAVEQKKIELLGSAAYHPIMPLIPKNLQMVEMIADTQLKRALWGIEKNCQGIFLPEMAFSQNILANLKDCDYQWTVLDDEVFKVEYNNRVPYDRIVSLGGFKIFLRSNLWSNKIAHGELKSFYDMAAKMEIEFPKWTGNQPAYLILALDAETFGHHRKGLIENFLEPMINIWGKAGAGIITPLEEIANYFPSWDLIRIANTSWSSSEKNFWNDNAFPLWDSKSNEHHRALWKLVHMALKYREIPGASWDCLKIVSSCHWWWISGRPHWKPEFMKFGAKKAMRIIKDFGSEEEKEKAKEIYEKLMALK